MFESFIYFIWWGRLSCPDRFFQLDCNIFIKNRRCCKQRLCKHVSTESRGELIILFFSLTSAENKQTGSWRIHVLVNILQTEGSIFRWFVFLSTKWKALLLWAGWVSINRLFWLNSSSPSSRAADQSASFITFWKPLKLFVLWWITAERRFYLNQSLVFLSGSPENRDKAIFWLYNKMIIVNKRHVYLNQNEALLIKPPWISQHIYVPFSRGRQDCCLLFTWFVTFCMGGLFSLLLFWAGVK